MVQEHTPIERVSLRTRLRGLLIDPWVPLQPPLLQRNQALSFLLFVLVISGTLITIVYALIVPDDPGHSINVIGIMLIGLIYMVSRSGYQQIAVGLTFLISTIPIYLLALPFVGAPEYVMLYLLIPITVAVFFMPLRPATLLALANLVGMLVMALAVDTLSFDEMLIGPFSIATPVALILLILRALNKNMIFNVEDGARIEEHYTQLMDFHPEMIAVHHDGHIVYVNQQGLAWLGYDALDEIIGQPISTYISQDDQAKISAKIIQSKRGQSFAMRTLESLQPHSGPVRSVEVTAMPILYEGVLATQLLIRDLTEQQLNEESLHELEASHRNIIELMADYTYEASFDADGLFRLIWLSRGFTELTGHDIAEMLDKTTDLGLVLTEDLPIVESHVGVLFKGQSNVTEFRIIGKAGQILWVRDYAQPVWDDTHTKVIGCTGTVQNITERTQAEISLKNHALQQAVVAELGQRALGNPAAWDTLMDEAVTLTAQVLNVEYCRVLELDPATNTLTVRSVAGWPDAMIGETEAIGDDITQATYTLRANEPVTSRVITDDQRFSLPSTLQAADIQGSISVVIQGQARALGVLQGHTTTPRAFSLDDINFVQSIANILAAFLEQQRTQHAEREQRSMVESLHDIALTINSTLELDNVLDRVLENLSRVLPYDAASIMVKRGDIAQIIRHAGHERFGSEAASIYDYELKIADSPILTEMMHTGQPLYIPDVRGYPGWKVVPSTEWIRSYIGAPIIFQGEPLGFINVDSTELDAFTAVHEQRLLAFASQVSIAMRNARRASELEDEVRSRTHELDVERRSIQSILEATGEGIIYTKDGEIEYANETFYQMTGHTPEMIRGKQLVTVVQPLADNDDKDAETRHTEAEHEIQQAWQTISKGEIWRGELRFIRQDQTTFEAGLTMSRSNEIDGVLYAVTIMRDISQLKAIEAEQARFIADASHDLRNPVTVLSNAAYMLERQPENPRWVSRIRETTEELSQLIEELLTYFEVGRSVNFQMRQILLQDLLKGVVEVQRDNAVQEKGITISDDLALEPISVYADPTHMKRVIRNLIANAINYTQASGQITVCLYEQVFDEVETSEPNAAPKFSGPMAVITVQDDGIGIKPEDIDRIFKPWVRLNKKIKGTGLGLSISREIVRKHGGDIRVESLYGEGSTFYVILPLLPAAT